jgi:lauroyl-KDO2-lipid IV(A) myristoyltransferase
MSNSHRAAFKRHFLLPKYWPTWVVVLCGGLLAFVPSRMRAALGDRLARPLCRADSKRTRISLTNLALCYPQLSAAQRQELLCVHSRVFTHVFLGYGDLLLRSPRRLRDQFDIQGLDIVEQEVARGKGIILLTPHSLALEFAAQRLALDYPMVAIARVHHKNDVLDWVVTGFRTRYQDGVYSNTANMLGLVKQVRGGKWLYYLPDEDRGEDNTVFAPFYGIQKATTGTVGRLARSCRAAVVPMMTAYAPETRRFLIRFHEPMAALTGEDLQHDAAEVNRAIERILDEDRAQYMWSAKIFRTRPEGEPPLYRDS